MRIGKVMLATVALAAASAPIAGQAVAAERAAAPVSGENAMGGGTGIAVLFGLVALAVFVLATDTNDEPASP